jgi:hypothetical protein
MPDTCWGPLCDWIHILSLWLKLHVLPFAPLFTPIVATVAGAIALYSIHVTRSVARKRAAVDFFLKTDMDKGMVEAHAAFQAALYCWQKHEAAGKSIETFVRGEDNKYTAEYKDIMTYLNIHELVAVGIKNKIFDHAVCYNFWSDALVRHTDQTRKLIEYETSGEGSEASFLELRMLSIKWKKRTTKWQEKERAKGRRKGLRLMPGLPAPAPDQSPQQPSPQTADADHIGPAGQV